MPESVPRDGENMSRACGGALTSAKVYVLWALNVDRKSSRRRTEMGDGFDWMWDVTQATEYANIAKIMFTVIT